MFLRGNEIHPVDKSVIDADNDQGDNSIKKLGKISGMENSFWSCGEWK